MPNHITATKKINWRELIIFYIISVLVSAPFRLNLLHPSSVLPLPYGLNILYNVLRGIGPLVGFVTVVYILKSKVKRDITFFGLNKFYSFMAIIIIPLGLTIAGVHNEVGLNENYYGFIYGLMLVLYAIGEEYGWRGYLQQALAPLAMPYRILLIAILWYIWHLNFLIPGTSLQVHLIHFFSLLLGAWGLLKVSESTHSILFAVAVHLSFNIFSDVDCNYNYKLLIIGVAIVIWVLLIRNLLKTTKKQW